MSSVLLVNCWFRICDQVLDMSLDMSVLAARLVSVGVCLQLGLLITSKTL